MPGVYVCIYMSDKNKFPKVLCFFKNLNDLMICGTIYLYCFNR